MVAILDIAVFDAHQQLLQFGSVFRSVEFSEVRFNSLVQRLDFFDTVDQQDIQVDETFLESVGLSVDSQGFPNGSRHLRLLAIQQPSNDCSQGQQRGAENCDQEERPGSKQ